MVNEYLVRDCGDSGYECYRNGVKFFQHIDGELSTHILNNEIAWESMDSDVDEILKSCTLNESINLFEEELYEMASIRSKTIKDGLLLAINPDQHRLGDAYFKMYDTNRYNTSNKVARFSFFEPRIISHRCKDKGKQPWLNIHSYDIKHLEDLLDSESITFNGFTVWDELKYFWNSEYGFGILSPIEYFNGEYDDVYGSHPSYVPSTLEPPNYMEIVSRVSEQERYK